MFPHKNVRLGNESNKNILIAVTQFTTDTGYWWICIDFPVIYLGNSWE